MIELDAATFRYSRSSDAVFSDLTLRLNDGQTTAVTGKSGCGKSTLLYVIGLMLRTIGGEVAIDGRPTSGLNDAERSALRAARIGFVFQDAALDPSRTVLENVLEGALFAGVSPAKAHVAARALLERTGVRYRYDHRPGEISGGQAGRVALCRALVKEPSIILADEPTGNLDGESARVVWEVLTQQAQAGCTVVIATHDQGMAHACDAQVML